MRVAIHDETWRDELERMQPPPMNDLHELGKLPKGFESTFSADPHRLEEALEEARRALGL